ncbi:hypothetical protein ID866_8951 [Astraeus odoratus]|nr:hypothetical protein ID866_8951 [Astraeus odoratus]
MEVHLDLALASMKVMQVGLRFNICGLESSYVRNSDVQNLDQRVRDCIPPHLAYACQYWAHHLQQVRFNYMLVKEIRAVLLTEYIVFWMEVLSLVRTADTVHCAMPILMAWVEGHHDQEALSAVSQDAIKFMQTFGGAIYTSTPHLYISALALCPTSSSILGQVMHKFRRLPQVMTGQQEEWPIGKPFEGHTYHVFEVAFSSDGRQIVSGSLDGTIRIWDVHTGSQIGIPFEGHTGGITSVSFSPDSKWIVSGSEDNTIRAWDAHTGSQIGNPFIGHSNTVHSVAFSPDGKWIVSGSDDKTIRVWEAHAGSLKVNNDGWITGPGGKLLLWIPGYYHAFLYSPKNALVIPRGGPELNLSMIVHGHEWHDCYIRN